MIFRTKEKSRRGSGESSDSIEAEAPAACIGRGYPIVSRPIRCCAQIVSISAEARYAFWPM